MQKIKYPKSKLVFTIGKIVNCEEVQNGRRLKMINNNFIVEF
jgi:hypothetical protein